MAQDPNADGDIVVHVSFGETKFDLKKAENCKFLDLKKQIVDELKKSIKDWKHKDASSEHLLFLLNGNQRLSNDLDNGVIISCGFLRGANIPKNSKQLSVKVEESFGLTIKLPNVNEKHEIFSFPSELMRVLFFRVYNTIGDCKSPYFDLYLNDKKLELAKLRGDTLANGIKSNDELECKYTKTYDNNGGSNVKYGVKAKSLTGQTHEFNAFSNLDVDGAKQCLWLSSGIPHEQQRLIFAGKQLEDDKSFKTYGITEPDSVLHLVLRLRGN